MTLARTLPAFTAALVAGSMMLAASSPGAATGAPGPHARAERERSSCTQCHAGTSTHASTTLELGLRQPRTPAPARARLHPR